MKLFISILIISFNLFASDISSSDVYNSVKNKKNFIFKEIENYIISLGTGIPSPFISIMRNSHKEFEFKEKKISITKMQDRVTLKRYLLGYLGAKYHNDIKKLPYAYAYVIKHSEGEALDDFYKNNKLEKLIENKKKGFRTYIKIHENSFYFEKLDYDLYNISVYYDIRDEKNQLLKFKVKFDVLIHNRDPFDFFVLKENVNWIK